MKIHPLDLLESTIYLAIVLILLLVVLPRI
jgi:hypothetical protein